MTQVKMPDPQHLMYDALRAEVDRLMDEGVLSGDDVQYFYDPESVVFTCDDITEEDYNERFATIKLVGERDLAAKIDHWTRVLLAIEEGTI